MGFILNPYRYGSAASLTYQETLEAQGATNYWELQTARSDTATEPDLIGSEDMTMTSGAVTALSSGDGPFGGTDVGVTFAYADTEYMRTTNTFDPDHDFSMSMWVRAGTLNNPAVLFTFTDVDGNDYLYLIRYATNGICLQAGTNSAAQYLITSDDISADSTWHHIAVVHDHGSTPAWYVYIDGTAYNRVEFSGSFAAGVGFGIAGRMTNSPGSIGFNGDVAHVAFADNVVWGSSDIAAQVAFGA